MAASKPGNRGQTERPATAPPILGFGPRGGGGMWGGHLQTARAQDAQGTLRRLGSYLRRQRSRLALVIVLVIVSTALNLAGPYLMGHAIDWLIQGGDLPGLARLVLLMLAAYASVSLIAWVQTVTMIRVAQLTVRDLRRDLFGKMQTLPLRFFDERTHGELMSRLTNDIDNVNAVLQNSLTSFLSALFMLPGVVIVMLATNVWLALVSLAVVPPMALLTRYIARNSRQGYRDQQKALGVLNGMVEETITGGKVILAYGRGQAMIEEFDQANATLRSAAIRAQTYTGVFGPVGGLVNNTGFAIVVGAGAWMAVRGLATVGTIASFISYAEQLRRPVNEIANLFNSIQSALAGAERVFAIIDEAPEAVDEPDAVALESIRGKVVFEDVDFGYKAGQPVLKHVSLHAEPGQTIAVVGPTGAGKTTIINLLSRFYDVDNGRILVDDHDIRSVRRADLRRQLGVVLQDTYLFSESVMHNIRYGRLDATDEEVYAAAHMANADHFIRRLPHGYDTVLTERAGNLSQGQRQLLAIARAILANPRILVLDEATSSVDTRTEVQIQEALLRLMRGRTAFVIAHRLSTIRNADNILVIRDGEIVEQGAHDDLLAQGGFYHRLYMSQFKGTMEAVIA